MPKSESTHTQSRRIGRRNYMRAMVGGATAVGAGSVGVTLGSKDARAVLPAIGVGAALGTGAAAGYLVREAQDYFTGESVSEGAYNQMEADQAHADAKSDTISMHEANETVLTTISNLLANSQNAAFADAKYAAVEAMNLGKTKADVKAAAVPKVDTFFVTQQKNLFNHFSVQAQTWVNIVNSLEDTPNISWSNVFLHPFSSKDNIPANFGGKTSLATKSFTLVDGNTFIYSIPEWSFTNNSGYDSGAIIDPTNDNTIKVKPVNSGSQMVVLDGTKWGNVLSDITSNHSNVVTEIETWIDGVYDSYNQGDIQLSELVDASTIADKAPDEQGYSYAGADLALMGLDGAEHKYKIDLKQDEKIVTGTVYAQGRTNSLEVGTVYSPGSITGTVWLAYEASDGEGGTVSDLIGLEQNFEILSGVDQNGEEVSKVTFSGNNQQTTDTDIQKIKEELQQLQDLQTKLEKQQQQEVTSAGGGGGGILPEGQLIDGISNKILGAAAAAVAIYGAISS